MLGSVLNEGQQRQPEEPEALRYANHAMTIFMAVGDTLNLARAYQIILWCILLKGFTSEKSVKTHPPSRVPYFAHGVLVRLKDCGTP